MLRDHISLRTEYYHSYDPITIQSTKEWPYETDILVIQHPPHRTQLVYA